MVVNSLSLFTATHTWAWLGVYTNRFSPITNITAATTRRIIGALSNHTFIITGAGRESYLSSETSISLRICSKQESYIDDFIHVMPSRLLIAEETLKTNDRNQKKLTTLPNGVVESVSENWRVVVVTLEKKVAMVVIFTYRVVALSFSSARKVGRARESTLAWWYFTILTHLSRQIIATHLRQPASLPQDR